MSDQELKYWNGFNIISGMGRVRFGQLENYFGNLENAWLAESGELKKAGLDNVVIRSILTQRPEISLDRRNGEAAKERRGFTYHDTAYPERLKEIYDYPPVLYLRGSSTPEDEYCIAVVGTRKPTQYGRQVTQDIVTDLVKSSITVASGLAGGESSSRRSPQHPDGRREDDCRFRLRAGYRISAG